MSPGHRGAVPSHSQGRGALATNKMDIRDGGWQNHQPDSRRGAVPTTCGTVLEHRDISRYRPGAHYKMPISFHCYAQDSLIDGSLLTKLPVPEWHQPA